MPDLRALIARCREAEHGQFISSGRDDKVVMVERRLLHTLLDVAEAAFINDDCYSLEHYALCELNDTTCGKEAKDRRCTCGMWEAAHRAEGALGRLAAAMEREVGRG